MGKLIVTRSPMCRKYQTENSKASMFDECLERGGVLDLVQHGNGKRNARSARAIRGHKSHESHKSHDE